MAENPSEILLLDRRIVRDITWDLLGRGEPLP